MNHLRPHGDVVLALVPCTKGFGYAIFEGPLSPVDWGLKEARADKNVQSLAKIAALIEWWQPEAVVFEDTTGAGSRRSSRVRRLLRAVGRLCHTKNIESYRYSRRMVRECFSQFGALSRYEIAQAIAKHVPELQPRLPPVRKIWKSEDARMRIFDAAALAFTFFYFERR